MKKYYIIALLLVIAVTLFGHYESQKSKDFGKDSVPSSEESKEEQAPQVDAQPTEVTQPGVTTSTGRVDKLFIEAAQLMVKKQYLEAEAKLTEALSLQPKNSNIMETYASLLNQMGKKTEALNWIDKAITLNPLEPNYWYLKIDLVKEKTNNNPQTMDALFKEALTKTNSTLNMVTAYASWLGQQGRTDEATMQWKKAIELYPQNKALYENEIKLLTK